MTTDRETPPEIPGYRHVRYLGPGGYAVVHVYWQERVHREVAVKVLDGVDPEAAGRPDAEVVAMTQFDRHPHIVQIIDAPIAEDGRRTLVMPYYSGGDVLRRVRNRGPLPVAEAIRLGTQMADALAKVHSENFVHCDVKPANILIDQAGYLLADFGIASLRTAAPASGEYGVSVPWSPRETLAGKPATARSDLYSLGATLWHVLKGRPPFHEDGGDNRLPAVERRIMTRPAPALALPGTPPDLEKLVRALLSPDPRSRPRSADEVRERLEALGSRPSQRTVQPPPDEWATRIRPAQPEPTPQARPTAKARPSAQAHPTSSGVGPASNAEPDSTLFTQVRSAPSPASTPPGPGATQVRRPEPTAVEPPEEAGPRRPRWLPVAVGAALLTGTVTTASVLVGGGHPDKARNTAATDDPAPGGGVLGEAEPPGVPTVTAARSDAHTLHFSWTYSAADSSDTFRWRISGSPAFKTTTAPAVDVPDPAGTRVCVQVEVFRIDGSNPQLDWSPEGCGS